MVSEILFVKDKKKFGYKKIVAIKPVGWKWGEGELNNPLFGIVQMEITDEQVSEFYNNNKWCVSDDEQELDITEIQFRPPPLSNEAKKKIKAQADKDALIQSQIKAKEKLNG